MKTKLLPGALALSLAVGGAAQAHEFRIYFEPGSAEFLAAPGPGALWYRQVIADAACYGLGYGVSRVVVIAHTDTAGPASVNQVLSEARGEAVAELLVRFGVPRSIISVEGRGETQPAVATEDGVSEMLNRRAIIVHQGLGFGEPCTGPTLPRLPSLSR